MRLRPSALLLLALLPGCFESTALRLEDGGPGDAAVDGGVPTAEELHVVATEWTTNEDVYFRFVCECNDFDCNPVNFGAEFHRCAEEQLRDRPEVRPELAALLTCYRDGFAEVAQCVRDSTCDTVGDNCSRDHFCIFPRCETQSSDAMEAVFDACTGRLSGEPGGGTGRGCFE